MTEDINIVTWTWVQLTRAKTLLNQFDYNFWSLPAEEKAFLNLFCKIAPSVWTENICKSEVLQQIIIWI